MVKNLKSTQCSMSVGWGNVVRRLEAFQNEWIFTDVEDISKIVRMIETMRDNAKIYWSLGTNAPLETGIGFTGNFHAEAILAAFLRRREEEGSVSRPYPCPVQIFLVMIII
jgi:hypothetical protein